MAFTAANGRTQTSLAEINVTPLVDVMLVLLIIFMVTAPVIQSGIEVNVPTTQTVKEIREERVSITITKKGNLYVGSEPVNVNNLGSQVKKLLRNTASKEVYVSADEQVSYGTVAKVIDTLRVNGIETIDLVTKPYQGKQK